MTVVCSLKKPRQKSVLQKARRLAWKHGETIAHYIAGVLDRESLVEIGESTLSIFSHALGPRTGSIFVGADVRRLTYISDGSQSLLTSARASFRRASETPLRPKSERFQK